MKRKKTARATGFLVNQGNRRFISGKTTFEQAAQQNLFIAIGLCVLEVLAILILADPSSADSNLYPFVVISATILIPAFALAAFYTAYLNRKLGRGLFIEAEIVRCDGAWIRPGLRKSSPAWELHITYRFKTPDGRPIERSIRRVRPDLNGEKPDPGTPLLVRYVDQRLFRVM